VNTFRTAVWPPELNDDAVLRALVQVSADGLAVVAEDNRFVALNEAAVSILGHEVHEALRRPSPFDCSDAALATQSGRRRTTWLTSSGRRRDLDYRIARLSEGRYAVWFSDVTDVVRQQERLTAITSAASSVADPCSLPATLEAVANEVQKTANIAAVQILAVANPDEELRVVGMAGLGEAPDFTERLSACRRLGARVRFTEALQERRPAIVLHRKPAIMADPAWAPLHEIMDRADWDSFAAMPLMARGRPLGVMNAFYVPGDDPGPRSLRFLEAMADHAAVAIDTALLLSQTRFQAQSEERRRLSRDLHDSVVQQVFSMRLQARALERQLEHGELDPLQVRHVVEQLSDLSQSALGDLRGLVFELRPLELAEHGLVDALHAHAANVQARTGLHVDVRAPAGLRLDLEIEQEEDLYRVLQEALHNVVKHAHASRASVQITAPAEGEHLLVIEVSDDGQGRMLDQSDSHDASGGKTLGLMSMRERIERWGGHFEAGPGPTGGWTVEIAMPTSQVGGR
jgi:signal transduction histidine kinase